ncbi:MAG TPA: long-chain-acyl-CoA synthetase [Caulobacteraceae bacterium]|nr:long-chain-acyl-CoA synthetase [Caulobacteraceae bacterium]
MKRQQAPAALLRREWRYLTGLTRTLLRVETISPTSRRLVCDDLEAAVDRWRTRPAIRFEGAALTYGEMDALANRFAHWALAQGLAPGDVVALILPNRLDYLPLWYGLTKVGVVAALINNQLAGEALAHSLEVSGAAHCVVDASTAPAVKAVAAGRESPLRLWTLGEPDATAADLAAATRGLSEARPDRRLRSALRARDVALLIYTSGTTGLPKAARVTHVRAGLYMRGFAGSTGARASDRIYVTLPLYHATGGLCAMGAALLNGASVSLRAGFSASHFWDEVVAEGATMFVYIGELCRYLVNQPSRPSERAHRLRLAFGNGLGRDVWVGLEERFAVPRILEFYGSTEGNVSLFNFDGKRGALGRVAPYLRALFKVELVRFDPETQAPVRGPDGLCVRAAPGEAGECVGVIAGGARTEYAGYLSRADSEKKVLKDAFRPGDRWFLTGDLMTRDHDGYFYFVDRVGDTFRWKGENVSTGEVAAALLGVPGVKEATVYGVAVPHQDGRAGMAALVVDDAFDLAGLRRPLDAALPAYAQPLFLRLTPALATTGTFKPRKLDLITDGFDPAVVSDPLYFHDRAQGFVPLTPALHDRIAAADVRL